jgi:hypothetical protein
MWRQELNRQMFDPKLQGPPNEFGALPPSGGFEYGPVPEPSPNLSQMFGRQNPPPYDPVYRMEKFDDTKTMDQGARDSRRNFEEGNAAQLHVWRPEQYNDPGSADPFRGFPMPRGFGRNPMEELYNQMPQPGVPKYPGMVMPAPDQSPEMSQLMEFYSSEDI